MKYQELVDVYSALEATTKRLEKTDDWRKVLYEWSYDVDYDKCE